MKVLEFAEIKLNLDEISESICSSFDFIGVDSNQDPCFRDGESGFENCIYDDNGDLIKGYTVVFEREQTDKNGLNKYRLGVTIIFIDNKFEAIDEKKVSFPLSASIDKICVKMDKMIRSGLKKIKQ